jgi:hypothetical protein
MYQTWVSNKGEKAECKLCGQPLMRYVKGRLGSFTVVEEVDPDGSRYCAGSGIQHQMHWAKLAQ